MAYTFVLTDLSGGALGEVMNAGSRKIILPLSKPPAAGFTITDQNPQLQNILTKDLYLKAYDGPTLRFHGPIVATEATDRDAGGVQVSCTAAGVTWRLAKRISGKSANPAAIVSDKGNIAKQLIDTNNADADTGIQTQASGVTGSSSYVPGPYKYTLACINELSDSFDGFDWREDPQEYAAGKIGKFYAADTINTVRPDVVFEYGGTRSNIRSFNYQRSWNDIADRGFHIPDDGPSAPLPGGVISQQDNTAISGRGLYETIVDASNIFDQTLRTQLVQEVVAVRKDPRRVVTFTPDFDDPQRPGRVPVFGTDYFVGDTVRVRLTPRGLSNAAFVDGAVRIYQMEINIDANGKATYTPTTVDEGPASV